MVEVVEPMHEHEVIGQQKSDAQWIAVFAHYFVTQWHIRVKTRCVTVKEGTVTQINSDAVHVVGIYGTDHSIPFRSIENVTEVGDATMPLDPVATQHIYEFARLMARGEHLRIKTADDHIEQAEVRHLTLSGITVVDTVDGVRISVPFRGITHIQSADAE